MVKLFFARFDEFIRGLKLRSLMDEDLMDSNIVPDESLIEKYCVVLM